jgi:hypothetical protein
MNMYKRLTLTAIVTLIGLGTVAQAEILAGGPVYGGPSSVGGSITCRVFNAGAFPMAIVSRQIFNNVGGQVALSSDSCSGSLQPTKTCAYAAPITGNLAFSCRMFEEGGDDNVRGVAEVQDSSHTVLNTVPLTK